MNLLYLHCHDMGRYNSLYGHAIDTPNLQSLARDSTLFRQAFCVTPTCSPSRGALLTGTAPHVNGLIGLTHRGFSLNDPEMHLSHYMRNKGYATALFGIQHESADVSKLGYDTAYTKRNAPDFDCDWATQAAEYIKNAKEPFYMAAGFYYPHRDFHKNTEIDEAYVAVPACLPDNAATRADMADYMTSVMSFDRCAGLVLDALKESGHYEDTVIILTTDHGIAFPHMKCNLYDSGSGVTLAIKPAGGKCIQVCDHMVTHMDVFPTICDLMSLPKPDCLMGQSLRGIIRGEATDAPHEEIFLENTYHAAYEPMRALRTSRYKYIKRYDPEFNNIVLPNVDTGGAKEFLLEHGWDKFEHQEEELYDLCFDPNERRNLINHPEYTALADNLRQRLADYMTQTNDPILAGYVPKPDGAKITVKTARYNTDKIFE